MDGTEIQTRQLAHRSRRHDVHGDPGDRVRTEKAPVRALFLRVQQMLQDRQKTVNRIGRGSVRGIQHTHTVKGAVYYAVAVNDHKIHIIT